MTADETRSVTSEDLDWLDKHLICSVFPPPTEAITHAIYVYRCLLSELSTLRSKLATARAEGMKEAAKIADPPPGPEPRGFQAHQIRVETRRWIASAIRSAIPKQTMGGGSA